MTRLRSLIKEVLSTPPKKKDCNCGCGGCGKKAPILTENKVKSTISEGLQYHIDKKVPLHESVYRIGSDKHFALINEARTLWVRGLIDVSEDDQAILETHLGNFGLYETVNFEGEEYDIISKDGDWVYLRSIHDTQVGRKEIKVKEKDITINEAEVPLDMPMVNEGEWPKELTSRYSDEYRLELEKVSPTYQDKPGRAKYRVIDIESGELKGTPVFGTPESLMAFADDLIKPQGGTQSSNFGESLEEVDRYSGFNRNPEDPDSVPFEPKGSVAQFKEDLRALFGKFKGDLKNPEFIKGVGEIMVSWKSLLRSQLDEAKKKAKKNTKKLNKPMRDSSGGKAYKVYVKDPKTKKIKTVRFGSGGLRAKINDKEARNAFAARHKCSTKKDKTKAGYWSCRLPRYAKLLGLKSNFGGFW